MSSVVCEMIKASVLTPSFAREFKTKITAELYTVVFFMGKQVGKYFLPMYIVSLEF